jgi:tripartite motif-containing protein 37
LKVYPKGNGLAREKYLSVFVEMSKALGTQSKYEYRIELLNLVDASLTVKREYCSTFEIGECWGYNQFEPLEQLQVKEFIEDDSLLFQVGIRNRNYRSLVYDQILYIELLRAQIAER